MVSGTWGRGSGERPMKDQEGTFGNGTRVSISVTGIHAHTRIKLIGHLK